MKILLIDDSTFSRTSLKRAIGSQHIYIEASEGLRGLELYVAERPDLVFLDLTMPGTNGMEILLQLLEIDSQARVIISTADIQSYSRQKANELGAVGYVNKPFTSEAVHDAVQKVLEELGGNK